jgi:hypothetical protein
MSSTVSAPAAPSRELGHDHVGDDRAREERAKSVVRIERNGHGHLLRGCVGRWTAATLANPSERDNI